MNAELKQAVERLGGIRIQTEGSSCALFNNPDFQTLLKAVQEMGEDTKRLEWLLCFEGNVRHLPWFDKHCPWRVYDEFGKMIGASDTQIKAIDTAMSNTKG